MVDHAKLVEGSVKESARVVALSEIQGYGHVQQLYGCGV
ncbi:hypothetical protein ACP70R_024988 [Stipagrostis hirtigluma subsp. patula]